MKYFQLLSLFFLLISCSKERTITIKAYNLLSGEPLKNMEFNITSSRVKKGIETFESIASGKTDNNGLAVVTLKLKRGTVYTIRAIEPENLCHFNTLHHDFTSEDENKTFEFNGYTCGTLSLLVQNIGCTGNADKMNFRMKYSFGDWRPWSNNYMGCYSVGGHKAYTVPAGPLTLEWKAEKDGYTIHDSIQVTIFPGFATDFHLLY